MSENIKMVPASCTQCGGTVEVDPESGSAVCPFCGTSFIVDKAINNYNVQHATIEHADNVNIDMTGSVKTVLDFVGDQMKESRAERRQARQEAARRGVQMSNNFFKLFGIMFGAMMVFAIVAFIVMQIFGSDDAESTWSMEEVYSEDSTVSCYIDYDGLLSVNITDPGLSEWYYLSDLGTENLDSSDADFDGYHFKIAPAHDSGTGFAVVAEYEEDSEEGAEPDSFGVVKFVIESGSISGISEVVHITDLDSYSFTK